MYDVVLAPLAILGTSVAAYEHALSGHRGRAWMLGLGAAIVFVAGIAKAIVSLRSQRVKLTHELEGCLHTLHAMLMADWDGEDDPHLRITVHKPIDGGATLEQILEYVGQQTSRKKHVGRRFPAQSGVVGRSLRLKKPLVAGRVSENVDLFVRELITDWAYTEADARQANTSVYSWMAIPLIERDNDVDEVRGVVYLDSRMKEFFSGRRESVALAACAGIARFISRR